MANFYVTHHKYPGNPQLFAVTLHKVAGKGVDEADPNFHPTFPDAEPTWKVLIYTTGKDSNGDEVGPIVAGVFGSEEKVNEFIDGQISALCSLIDWSQQGQFAAEVDTAAPVVVEQHPTPGQTDVLITSPIVIRVKDLLPGNGIDPNTVVMVVDGFTVNPTVTGNKYDYTFTFKPRPVFF